MSDFELRWKFFKDNIKDLRKTMHKLRNQTGEIMILDVWWFPPNGNPVLFAPWFIDLRTGKVKDQRSEEIINVKEMFKEKYGE